MPIYEYECQACGHQLEARQKMSDPALSDCPACNKSELKNQMSASGFRFKTKQMAQGDLPSCASGGCGAPCMAE